MKMAFMFHSIASMLHCLSLAFFPEFPVSRATFAQTFEDKRQDWFIFLHLKKNVSRFLSVTNRDIEVFHLAGDQL